jgi:Protein of unknown function (DUF3455)
MKDAFNRRAAAIALASIAVTGCATKPVDAPTDIPPALAVPAGQVPQLEARAVGVQIYECQPGADDAASGTWRFQAPEATLADASGRPLGKHYAGPTWESNDGSLVVGQLNASDPGPDAKAIPWLALTPKSKAGQGVFAATTNILRVRTAGGIAPAEACTAANAKQLVRVPYTATYYFYRAG